MILEDLRVAPALRAVELDHHAAAILQVHLVDAVLVAVQREQAPVAAQSRALQRIEHRIRGQSFIRPGAIAGHTVILRWGVPRSRGA